MSNESSRRDQRLQDILAAYLHDVENGQNPDRENLFVQHPDLANDLRSFLNENDKMRRLVDQQNAATVGPDLATDEPTVGAMVRYFGDYELLEEIARGGMGVVYKARQVSLNRIVALKMILRGELATPTEVQRFRAEAEAAANLDHPNIVPIYEVSEHEGQHFFSMKFVEGGSLAAKVASDKWGESKEGQRQAALLTATLARAVHHAHQRGILHRDLKPANILLDGSVVPMVTDFGLAKHVEADRGQTRTGVIVGTPSYMSPEQARSEKVLSTAADVYSLGAILYELLTGRPPFRGETPLQTLMLVMQTEPAPPIGIDRDLKTICLKCLNKEPARRYGSAEMLAEDLERWLRGEPIQARPVGRVERLGKWVRRKPAAAALIAVSVLVLAATVFVAVLMNIREREKETLIAQQKQERDQQEREKDRERLRDSFITQARMERLAGYRSRSLDTLRKATEIRRDDELRLEITTTIMRPGLRFLGKISTDFNRLGFEKGQPVNIQYSEPVWNSDGRYVAVRWERELEKGIQDRLDVLELPSGKLLASKNGRFDTAAFRPGTTQLVLVKPEALGGAANVVLWDAKTDQEVNLFTEIRKGAEWQDRALFSTDGSHLLTATARSRHFPIRWQALRIWNVTEKRAAKAPDKGTFQDFLSGHELLLLDEDRYLVWNCLTGREKQLTPQGLKPVGFSAAAKRAALRGRLKDDKAETLHIWDLSSGKRVGEIPGLSELPSHVVFSPNGRYVVCQFPADQEKSMRVWDCCLRKFTTRLNCPRGLALGTTWDWQSNIAHPSFNTDGSILASVIWGGPAGYRLCVWDTTTGDILDHLPGYLHWWSKDGQRLMVQGTGFIGTWEVSRPPSTYELEQAIKSLSLNRDGSRLAVNQFVCALASSAQGSELVGWDAAEAGSFPQLVGQDENWVIWNTRHDDRPKSRPDTVFLGAGIVGVMGSPAGSASWRLAYSTLVPRNFELFPGRTHQTELRQLSPRQRQIILPNDDPDYPAPMTKFYRGRFEIYDSVQTGKWAFAPEGPFLIRQGLVLHRPAQQPWTTGPPAGGGGGFAQDLWNYQEGKRLAVLGLATTWFQFSPDGRRFFRSGEFGNLEIWNPATAKVEKVLQPGGPQPRNLLSQPIFSRDSRRLLAVYSRNGEVGERAGVFEIETGREERTWKLKTEEWQVVDWSQDGTLLASGGADKMIHLWDAADGRELARWQGHDDAVTALLFSRDGQTLFSGSQDGTLKLWNLPFLRQELKTMNLDW